MAISLSEKNGRKVMWWSSREVEEYVENGRKLRADPGELIKDGRKLSADEGWREQRN